MKKTRSVLFLCFFIFFGILPFSAVHAQTYYYPTATQQQVSVNPQIQSLLNQIYGLLAQVKTLQNQTPIYTVMQPPYVIQQPPIVSYPPQYYPNGNYQYNTYNVSVTTNAAQYNNNWSSVVLNGTARLNGAPFATVWFEYGQNGNITQKTSQTQMGSNGGSFQATLSNINYNQQYYYRAVIQDPSGNIKYGSLVGFTGGNQYNNNCNYNNCNNCNSYNNCNNCNSYNNCNNCNSYNNYNNDCNCNNGYYNNCGDYNNGNIPDVNSSGAQNITANTARLSGTVSMNGYDNGIVFFVYGQNRNTIGDVDSDYSRYSAISENGQNLQKVQVDSNLNGGYRSYWTQLYGLTSNSRYYYRMCVEYRNDNNYSRITCDGIQQFDTNLY